MPIQDHNVIELRQLKPGAFVDVYRAENSTLLTSGTADGSGHFSHAYPAALGAAYAVVREVPGALAWSASEAVTAGTHRIHPTFSGYLMKCVVAGTTGVTAPTNDYPHRLWGHSHNCVVPAYYCAMVFNRQRCWKHGTGALINSNSWPDGGFDTWPWDRVVEIAGSNIGRYALLDDGSVKFASYYTPGTGNGGPDNAWAKVQALPKIVKMWSTFVGVWMLDINRQLHWLYDDSGGGVPDRQGAGDDLLSANPGPYRCAMPGSRYHSELGIVTDNGTFASNDSGTGNFNASYTSAGAFTGIEAVVTNYNHGLLASTEQGTRLRGWQAYAGTVIDSTLPDGDTAAILHGTFQLTTVQTRLGRRLTWFNTSSGNMVYELHRVFGGVQGRPEDIQVHSAGWMTAYHGDNVVLVTPRGVSNIRSQYTTFWGTSPWQSNVQVGTTPNIGTQDYAPFTLHANPIVLDVTVCWQLVEAPAAIPWAFSLSTIQQEAALIQDGTVSGTVLVDGAAAARQVIALQATPGGQGRQVVGETTSDAGDGSYSLLLEGHTDPVIVIALDAAGSAWSATAIVAQDARAFPTAAAHTGLVYQATVGGTTGASEPAWPTAIGQTVVDGSVTWQTIEYYRPLAHGPVHPAVS